MAGQQQQPAATFNIPVAYPPELKEVVGDLVALTDQLRNEIKDVVDLKNQLRNEIECYRTQTEKNVYPEKEAADYFNISLKSMREIRYAGKITFKPVKGQFFYTRQNLEDYVGTDQVAAKKSRRK